MSTSVPLSTTIAVPDAGRYWVDPDRTTVQISARHMFGLGRVTGTVAVLDAELRVGDPVSRTWLQARLDATTFDTGNPARDRAVHSAKYLDTAAHPAISFRGDAVRHTESGWIADGTVIAHGVAAPTELTIDDAQQSGNALTVRAHTRIDRHAHGITAGKGIAGRRITVAITATCYRIGDE